jgi:hypothetical protein
MLCTHKNFTELFKTGIKGSQNRVTFPWEEAVRAFINIWLVRVGLVISIYREHGTGMDHIASALVIPL